MFFLQQIIQKMNKNNLTNYIIKNTVVVVHYVFIV